MYLSEFTFTLPFLLFENRSQGAVMPVRQINLSDKRQQGQVIHVIKIFDLSSSMAGHVDDLIKVADSQVSQLAEASRNSDQETRVTIYTFSDPHYHGGLKARCLVYEKDVLRVPSIAQMGIRANGNTALCDAVLTVIDEVRVTPERYGDHSFLVYLLTDGMENFSQPQSKKLLPQVIRSLPDNWTMAAFVPSVTSKHYLTGFGFAPGNITIWDPSQEHAVEEVGIAMASATTSYLQMRSSNPAARSTTSLFEANAPKASEVKKNLTPLTPGSYDFLQVTSADLAKIENGRLDQFMELKTGRPYIPGRSYYEFSKRERIQDYKKILVALIDKASNQEIVYTGPEVRRMLGLPETGEVRVSPGNWSKSGYKVYILSTSSNRKLAPGTRVLVVR